MHFLEIRKITGDVTVPVVLMHSRGEASANHDYHYSRADRGQGRSVVGGVRAKLSEGVEG